MSFKCVVTLIQIIALFFFEIGTYLQKNRTNKEVFFAKEEFITNLKLLRPDKNTLNKWIDEYTSDPSDWENQKLKQKDDSLYSLKVIHNSFSPCKMFLERSPGFQFQHGVQENFKIL